jgi:hypothetical protein
LVRESQANDDGSDNALWRQFERESADSLFRDRTQDGDSILTTVFIEKVAIKNYSVGYDEMRGSRVATITISLRDLVLADGFPVYWKPNAEALSALGSLLGLMEGREWVEWLYAQY